MKLFLLAAILISNIVSNYTTVHSLCTFYVHFISKSIHGANVANKRIFYTYLTYNFIFLSIHFLTYLKCYIYVDVLMYVPIVYGFLPEINVFVFVAHTNITKCAIHNIAFDNK